jgi:hypothetical protein
MWLWLDSDYKNANISNLNISTLQSRAKLITLLRVHQAACLRHVYKKGDAVIKFEFKSFEFI